MAKKNTKSGFESDDVLWGCEAIGKALGINKRRTFHLIDKRQIPARMIGGRWCITRRKLIEFIETGEESAA